MEIIQLMVREKTSGEIAQKLGISTRTVETHRHNIQKKIGVKSVVGIVVFAIKNGYVGEEVEG
jgi:DNA-binding CsgD family transcriptional regulator